MSEYLRFGVGAVVTDGQGKVLAFERSSRPDSWQLPQGGVDEGEATRDAVFRELEEETGIPPTAVTLLAELPVLLGYELPPELRSAKTKCGQCHRWFLLRLDADVEIDTASGGEFARHRWMTMAELHDKSVAFRQPVYAELARLFGPQLGG